MQLVEFTLADGRYGLPMDRVLELAASVPAQPLPGAPAVVEGMINYGGVPTPLVSLRRVFALEERASGEDHLILARGRTRTFALRVDRALGLVELADEAVRAGAPSRHVRGVAVIPPNDLLYIQDLDQLLSLDEETRLTEALMANAHGATASAG